MMHGIIRPLREATEVRRSPVEAFRTWLRSWSRILLVVVLPTALLAGYYYLIAADQYESEAHFSITQGSGATMTSGGFGELVGLTATSPSQTAANNVSDFLLSHDAVAQLRRRLDLVGMFRRPEADIVSKLRKPDPTPELLLRYYRSAVLVHFDRDTGLTTLRVRAYRPADAYQLAQTLLSLGERRVNAVNTRSYADAVASAEQQLAEAEQEGARTRRRITGFRQVQGDIDPTGSGQAQLKLVADLKAKLAAATAQLSTVGAVLPPTSPQYLTLEQQIRSLQDGIATQSRLLAGGTTAIATDIGNYEDLKVRQDYAAKRYDVAAAALAKAREDARRQQLYLVRVVDPNLPVKSLFPQRGRIILTVFLSLIIAYSIGWLIMAGVREHAA